MKKNTFMCKIFIEEKIRCCRFLHKLTMLINQNNTYVKYFVAWWDTVGLFNEPTAKDGLPFLNEMVQLANN